MDIKPGISKGSYEATLSACPWPQTVYRSPFGAIFIHDTPRADQDAKRQCLFLLSDAAEALREFLNATAVNPIEVPAETAPALQAAD